MTLSNVQFRNRKYFRTEYRGVTFNLIFIINWSCLYEEKWQSIRLMGHKWLKRTHLKVTELAEIGPTPNDCYIFEEKKKLIRKIFVNLLWFFLRENALQGFSCASHSKLKTMNFSILQIQLDTLAPLSGKKAWKIKRNGCTSFDVGPRGEHSNAIIAWCYTFSIVFGCISFFRIFCFVLWNIYILFWNIGTS